MKSKRIQWLDFARGITIFFVVCGHSLSGIYSSKAIDPIYFKSLMAILFTFMMPCFFAISGYLYKPVHNLHSFGILFYKKIISLGIPYIVFSVIYVCMQQFGGNSINNAYSFSSLLKIYATPISYLWFLYALFIMFLIISVFDLLRINKYIQFILCLLLMIVSIIFPDAKWSGITYTFNNIIYFYFGYLISSAHCKQSTINILKSHKATYLFSLIFIGLLIIQSFLMNGGPTNNSTFFDFITKLMSISLLIQISSIMPHNKFFKYFDKYGKITLIIYLVHAPVMSVIRALSFKLLPITDISVIVLSVIFVIIVWYVSIFACYLSNKISIINFVFYPRKQYISKWVKETKFGRKFLRNQN